MFREVSLSAMGAYGLLTSLWVIGSVLLGRYAFRLRGADAVLSGLALGFVSFETLANAGAHFLPLPAACWLSAAVLLLMGGTAWYADRGQPLALGQHWGVYAAFAGLLALLFPVQRGLALFDEFLHIPLVAEIARGYVPPPFYLDPSLPFAYHYGLHVWAASLVRMAGWFPWAALDAGKAFTIALTVVLAWLWFYRTTRSRAGANWGAAAVFFGSGVRWLLLFLPREALFWLSAHISLQGSAADTGAILQEALSRPWRIEGGGQVPFPFAFHGGFFTPMYLAVGNTAAMSWMTVLALLIVGPRLRRAHWTGWAVVTLTLASLALSAEHLFAFLLLGIAAAGAFFWLRERRLPPQTGAWVTAMAASGALSLWQGGYITETLRSLVLRWRGESIAQANAYGFALRWPPAIPTAHFGALSLFDPAQALVLLTEFGLVLLLIPAAWRMTRRALRRSRWVLAGLALASWFNLVFALFIRYGLDRSMTRMPGTAARLWLFLGWPLAWTGFKRLRDARQRFAAQAALGMGMLGGILLFALALTTKPQPQLTYFVESTDALMSQRFWGVLPPRAQVLDILPYRSVALFGWPVRAFGDVYRPYPEWETLIANPDPQAVAAAGYDFVYMDEEWWRHVPVSVQQDYETKKCVRRLGGEGSPPAAWRALYDVRRCR